MLPINHKQAKGNFIGFAPVSFASMLHVTDLQQSAEELEHSAGFYKHQKLLTGQEATRENFFRDAPSYAVLTVFTHAAADTTGSEPVLYMRDSVIHLSELQLLKNPSIQFVLLSACQTNIGKNATGEGIYSLARGFAAAGIPAVSATLWKADEQTVYRISAKFNEYLSKGMNKSEALQKAKIWFLQTNEGELTLPFFWANMVLIGSSQPITFRGPSDWWKWMMAALLLAITLAWIVRKDKKNTLAQEPTTRQLRNFTWLFGRTLFFPYLHKMHECFYSFLHVFYPYPLMTAVNSLHTRE